VLSPQKKRHLQYLYHGGDYRPYARGSFGLCSPLATVAKHDMCSPGRCRSEARSDSAGGGEEKVEAECIVVESPEALRAVEQEIPSALTYSVESLRNYLARDCVVFLLFCPEGTSHERAFVGYGIYQLDVLSLLGQEKSIPLNILCTIYHEMLPAYRGQRYSNLMRATRDEYCRKQGVKFLCGTVAPENRPSVKAVLTQGGYQIIGTVVRVSLLKGRFIWETPWEKIEAALRDFFR
jgi:hypothetical protein